MTPAAIRKKLTKLPGWRYHARQRTLVTQVRCRDFLAAVRLIGNIARLAERMDHHPDLHLTRYRRLKIVLTTHSAGGVTPRDFALANKIVGKIPGPKKT